MSFKVITLKDANRIIANFSEIYPDGIIEEKEFDSLPDKYKIMRTEIFKLCNFNLQDYKFDIDFGLNLYEYLKSYSEFSESVAADFGFWRYLSCRVVPDLIYKRHGYIPEYYYKKTVRMYLPTMWWYIHLTYQGSKEATKECLLKFNTDYIVNLVERTGKGVYPEITRAIFKELNNLDENVIHDSKRGNQSLFRRLMIVNTAKTGSVNGVVEGNVNEYVYGLFKVCGVELEKYG